MFENVSFCKTERIWALGNNNPEDIGPLPPSIASLKRTGGEGTGAAKAQQDMPVISPVICIRAGVATLTRIYMFPKQVFQNERANRLYSIHARDILHIPM